MTRRAHYVAPPPLFQGCAGCTLLRLRVWELERLLGLGAQSASSTTYEEETPSLQGDLLDSIKEAKKEKKSDARQSDAS